MVLSQHPISSSKTVRPVVPSVWLIIKMWSAVRSGVLHLQFGEGPRPHLCMDKWNFPTPVWKQLSLTQAAQGKLIPAGLVLVMGMKTQSLGAFSQYCTLCSVYNLSAEKYRCLIWQSCSIDSVQMAQMDV